MASMLNQKFWVLGKTLIVLSFTEVAFYAD